MDGYSVESETIVSCKVYKPTEDEFLPKRGAATQLFFNSAPTIRPLSAQVQTVLVGSTIVHDSVFEDPENDPINNSIISADVVITAPADSVLDPGDTLSSFGYDVDVEGTYQVRRRNYDDGGEARAVAAGSNVWGEPLPSNDLLFTVHAESPVTEPSGTADKDATGWWSGNGVTGSDANPNLAGARYRFTSFESDLGRRVLHTSNNLGTISRHVPLGNLSTRASDDTVFKDGGHGLTVRDTCHITVAGAGLTIYKNYWVKPHASDPERFHLANSKNGATIPLSDATGVPFVKHDFLGDPLALVRALRNEWATRPDVELDAIFHMITTPTTDTVAIDGHGRSVPPAIRRLRQLEHINGEWDSKLEQIMDAAHVEMNCTYDPATGVFETQQEHTLKQGERLKLRANTGGSIPNAFNSSGFYYVKSIVSNKKFTLSASGGYGGLGALKLGGSAGDDFRFIWRLNLVLRVAHESSIPHETGASRGYPDGKLWENLVGSDEVNCRRAWEHILRIFCNHGFQCIWADNGTMFNKIYSTGGKMGYYAQSFPEDDRDAVLYAMPGAVKKTTPGGATPHANQYGGPANLWDYSGCKIVYNQDGDIVSGYIAGVDADTYFGFARGKSVAGAKAQWDDLRALSKILKVPYSGSEVGTFFLNSDGLKKRISSNKDTNKFTYSGDLSSGFVNGIQIVIYDGTPLASGVARFQLYYLRNLDRTAKTFQISLTSNGDIRDIGDGSAMSIQRLDTRITEADTKSWLNYIFDKALEDPAFDREDPTNLVAGSCRYANYFNFGHPGDGQSSNIQRYSPNVYQEIFVDRLGA